MHADVREGILNEPTSYEWAVALIGPISAEAYDHPSSSNFAAVFWTAGGEGRPIAAALPAPPFWRCISQSDHQGVGSAHPSIAGDDQLSPRRAHRVLNLIELCFSIGAVRRGMTPGVRNGFSMFPNLRSDWPLHQMVINQLV